jgi:hypothetical protein
MTRITEPLRRKVFSIAFDSLTNSVPKHTMTLRFKEMIRHNAISRIKTQSSIGTLLMSSYFENPFISLFINRIILFNKILFI